MRQAGRLAERAESAMDAIAGMPDGAVVFTGGFGRGGVPEHLIDAVCAAGLKELTVVNNNAGFGETGISKLIRAGCLRKLICSFPRSNDAAVFAEAFREGRVELEIVPQGTLAERIRAGGAGLGGFLTRTGVGTDLAEGKRTVWMDGVTFLLELPLRADFALIRADRVDPYGNLTYRMAARNFNPIMATAAKTVVVEAGTIVDTALEPEEVITPGLFVSRYFVVEPVEEGSG